MNINKSYLISVLLGCAVATQAYASNKLISEAKTHRNYSAKNLVVHVSKKILNNYNLLTDQIAVTHGEVLGCYDHSGDIYCGLGQAALYGPDVTLSFKRITDGQIAKIRVQQNFSFLEAGTITVTAIRGQWAYRTKEGSVAHDVPGSVWLDWCR